MYWQEATQTPAVVILRESNKYGGSFAAEALVSVLDLPPEQRINGIIHSVQRVHQALSRAGLAGDAADMVDGIEEFTHSPIHALPR